MKTKQPIHRSTPRPRLRFSPAAWAKLLCLRDLGSTEVGAFGISSADDLLYIEDVRLVKQVCTAVTVAFDDAAVADFFDEQIDAGKRPEQFARLWLHTHPGNCPLPSWTDEKTFSRVFGGTDWAVMFILACAGPTYARLRFNAGPGGETELDVGVDYIQPFAGSEFDVWESEYLLNVSEPLPMKPSPLESLPTTRKLALELGTDLLEMASPCEIASQWKGGHLHEGEFDDFYDHWERFEY